MESQINEISNEDIIRNYKSYLEKTFKSLETLFLSVKSIINNNLAQ